jgi:uncharacterized cupin superfamily protein
MSRPNIFRDDDGWDVDAERMQIRGRMVGRRAGSERLGTTVYELAPGASGFNLHAHYGMEELFVVLSGRPTFRDGATEEELAPGDVVSCLPGLRGLHTFANRSDEPARVLAISNTVEPEVVLYPEIGKVGVATRSPFEVPAGDDKGIVAMFDVPVDE